jgi:hypothetical protein
MTDRPDAFELLAIARSALQDELLPQLPPSAHYTARMISNAMAIASRELDAATLPVELQRELAALAGSEATADIALDAIAVVLADRLRAGDFDADGGRRRALYRALSQWTAARVAVSNPRAILP